jgi:cell division protein FtsL
MTAGALRAHPAADFEAVADAAHFKPRVRLWVLFALAVIVAFFGLIYSRISLDRSAFEIQELEQRINAEETRYWQLRLDVAELQSPQRIETLIADRGFVYPETRVALSVPGMDKEPLDAEYRWAQLKAFLSAQP